MKKKGKQEKKRKQKLLFIKLSAIKQIPKDRMFIQEITSPNASIRVTDINIAPQAGSSASRKMGKA